MLQLPNSATSRAQPAPSANCAPKKGHRAAPATTAGSEIIKHCITYVQSLAAFDAGYRVDASGEDAGNGNEVRNAQRAIEKLNTLSRAEGAPNLTASEIYAKAGVLSAMYGLREHEEPNEDERAYITNFAREVSRFLAQQLNT